MLTMRSHAQIIIDAGGPSAVGAVAGASPGAAKQWRRSNSIPGPYWQRLAEAKIATLDELARAAAARLQSDHELASPSDAPVMAPAAALGAGAKSGAVQ